MHSPILTFRWVSCEPPPPPSPCLRHERSGRRVLPGNWSEPNGKLSAGLYDKCGDAIADSDALSFLICRNLGRALWLAFESVSGKARVSVKLHGSLTIRDQAGKRRLKTFATKKEADAWAVKHAMR